MDFKIAYIDLKRRHFLKKIFSLSVLSYTTLFTRRLRAEELVESKVEDVSQHPMYETIVSALGDYDSLVKADKVDLFITSVIEYKDSVTIRVSALKRKDIDAIAIIIDNNSEPLVIVSQLSRHSDAYLSVRAHLEKTSLVRAIVKTADGLEEINAMAELKTIF